MDAREKLNEFAELHGWDKNKLIGWSEAADFGEWLVKECSFHPVTENIVDHDWEMIETAPYGTQYKHKLTGKIKWE